MSDFSRRFRQLKDESGLTLKELSEKLDITIPNLSYYMKGREPNYDTLIRIANYFNVTTDWLVGNKKMPNVNLEDEKHELLMENARLREKMDKVRQLFDE